jgi:chromosome partitioning protein
MPARILAIANQKGGVGKTTTTLSLGVALARSGHRVLMLDLDPHICASVHLRFFPGEQRHTLLEIFQADPPQWPELWPLIITRQEDQICDFAPGSVRLSELEGDLKDRRGKGMILKEALEIPAGAYDYILLDCPPHMGLLMANALVAADLLIIPIQTDFLALHGLMLLFDTIRTLNKALPSPIRYRAFATMYDRRAGACTRVLEMLTQKLGDSLFSTVISLDTRFREASALGKVIYDIDPQCKGARGYTALAEEVSALW